MIEPLEDRPRTSWWSRAALLGGSALAGGLLLSVVFVIGPWLHATSSDADDSEWQWLLHEKTSETWQRAWWGAGLGAAGGGLWCMRALQRQGRRSEKEFEKK